MFAFLDLKRKVILSPLPSRATRTRLTTVEQTGLIFYYEPINMIASTRVVTLAYSLHKTLRTLSVVAPTAAPLSISFCLFCWEVARLMPPVTSPCGRNTSCVARNVSSCTGRAWPEKNPEWHGVDCGQQALNPSLLFFSSTSTRQTSEFIHFNSKISFWGLWTLSSWSCRTEICWSKMEILRHQSHQSCDGDLWCVSCLYVFGFIGLLVLLNTSPTTSQRLCHEHHGPRSAVKPCLWLFSLFVLIVRLEIGRRWKFQARAQLLEQEYIPQATNCLKKTAAATGRLLQTSSAPLNILKVWI